MEMAEGMGLLQGAIKPPKKELSLKTLSKKEKKKIMSAYMRGRDAANRFYLDTVQPSIIKRNKIYEAPVELYRKKFPKLSELCDWISRDVKTTIDWMIPALMDVFSGTDDPCDIQGQNIEDDKTAKKLQSIVKYQINKKNDYFTFLINFIREGLITNQGVAKVYWHRDEDRTEMEVMVDETNLDNFIQLAQMGEIEIKELELVQTMAEGVASPVAGIMKYDDITVHYNAPVLENMSPSELRFTPDGKDLQSCKFVAQRKIVKGDYLKRKEQEGLFVDVDKAIKKAGESNYTELDQYNNQWLNRFADSDLSDDDDASKNVELYEAYLDVDYNNDGIMEHLIIHAVGDIPLAIQENTFRSIPFYKFSPELDPYTPFGEGSYADTLEQLQDLKTALIRQIIIAVGKNNRPQRFVAEQEVDMDALLDGEEIIPVRNGKPQEAIMISPHIPIDQTAMTMVEYAQSELESQSGSTKYNQGLDSNSLNKTASGINAIMGAADKRMRLLARIFAETAWVPIIKHIIKLNQQFITPYQQFRLNNEMVSVAPDELDIDYDLTVNTGQGAATKEAQMNYLIMIMQQLFPTLQQLGIVTENSWYETTKDLFEKMGIRNVQTYLLDPNSDAFKMLAQQKAEQAKQAELEALNAQKELQQTKLDAELQRQSIPRTTLNYRDLPIEAKVQAIQQLFGITVSLDDVADKEIMDAQKGGN